MANTKKFTPKIMHFMMLRAAKFMILNHGYDYDSTSMDNFLNSMENGISKNEEFMNWFFENISSWMETQPEDSKYHVGDIVVIKECPIKIKKIKDVTWVPAAFSFFYYMTDGSDYTEDFIYNTCEISKNI